MTSNGWDDARKAKQRKAIHRWRPWEKSTGPKTGEGKLTVSRNALKHGQRSQAAIQQEKAIRRLLKRFGALEVLE